MSRKVFVLEAKIGRYWQTWKPHPTREAARLDQREWEEYVKLHKNDRSYNVFNGFRIVIYYPKGSQRAATR